MVTTSTTGDVMALVARYGAASADPPPADIWAEIETALGDAVTQARQSGRDEVLDSIRTIAASRAGCTRLRETAGVRVHIAHGMARDLLRTLIDEVSVKGDAGRVMGNEPGA